MAREQKQARLILRLSSKLKVDLEATAERAGFTLSEWARATLARAAREGAFAPPKRRKRHADKK